MSSSSSLSTKNRNITNAQRYQEALQNPDPAPTERLYDSIKQRKQQQQQQQQQQKQKQQQQKESSKQQQQQQQQEKQTNFPPIHPSIIQFANLPPPTKIQDLPPSHILESDVDLYKFMAQRAHATACVLSHLAHTPQAVSLATANSSLERDCVIYDKILQHSNATYKLLERHEEVTGIPDTVCQEIKATAISLEASLIVTRPALLLLTPTPKSAVAAAPKQKPVPPAAKAVDAATTTTTQGSNNSSNNKSNNNQYMKEIRSLWIKALRMNDLMDLPRTLLLESSPAELLLTICIAQFRFIEAESRGMVGLACRHCGASFWSMNENELGRHLTQTVVNHVSIECQKCPVQESARRLSQEFGSQPSEHMPLIQGIWCMLQPSSPAGAAREQQQTGSASSISLVANPLQNAAQYQHQHQDDPAMKRRRLSNPADDSEAGADTY